MASLRKVDARYNILYRDINGKQKTKPIGKLTKRQAERELFLFNNGGSQSAVTFYNFCHDYVKWHAFEYPSSHKRVRQIIEQHLFPAFGGSVLSALTIEDGERYKQQRRGEVSVGSLVKEVRTLKAILNKAVEWGRIDANPLTALKPPKEVKSDQPPFYTAGQLNELYAVCDEYEAATRHFMLIQQRSGVAYEI